MIFHETAVALKPGVLRRQNSWFQTEQSVKKNKETYDYWIVGHLGDLVSKRNPTTMGQDVILPNLTYTPHVLLAALHGSGRWASASCPY
jgi:hypothetical protein